jgi:hypothetical protein
MESVLHDIGRRGIADDITKAHRGHASGRGGEAPGGHAGIFTASGTATGHCHMFSRWSMQVGMSQGYAVNSMRGNPGRRR